MNLFESTDIFLAKVKKEFDNIMIGHEVPESDRTQLWNGVLSEFENRFGDNSSDLIDFESLICIAKK